jgi:polar amino acid transport system substrate-binding protein
MACPRQSSGTEGFAMMHLNRVVTAALALGLAAAMIAGKMDSASAQGAKCEPEQIVAKYPSLAGKTIKVATDAESPPYSFRDPKDFNRVIGIDVDMARAAFKCIGAKMELSLGAWSGLLPSVIAGQNDLMWDDLYYTAKRAEQVDYVAYMVAGTGGLVRKGNPKNIHDFADLCGLTGTAGLGTVEEAALRDQSKKCIDGGKKEINILTYPDISSGVRLVQNDRADVMVTDLALVDQLSSDNPTLYERGIKVLSDFKIGVAVKKGNKDLLTALYDSLTVLHGNGEQKQIFGNYKVDAGLIVTPTVLTK